ncbi:acylneuraminate cytidylyltransferase family protein [Paenibacillus wynnii]|uniref:acylneuraminate cytidylyltransferase family protein n=1 Tax=Paenibacillus wynnii TaxID=268407 RepID=UPI0027931833|nr:acylneuraminate cytidylyltransferase family protein [Paenibacillus wynnii]MDQ0194835.1 N-acylneuraminate cytidylyltransferase/CMP-N,N'-diacetyllegionaminic acid synthase [Paenibacillus wynnii]
MKRLCTICARGHSKGVLNKNIRVIGDKPLLAYSIIQAKASGMFDCIAVSSDSSEILDTGLRWGADISINRPPALSSDNAPKIPAIRHCLEIAEQTTNIKFDVIADLDVTSPLREAQDIQGAIRLLIDHQAPNVITGTPSRRSPYFNMVEVHENGEVQVCKPLDRPFVRRQDTPLCFDLNASVYVWRRDCLLDSDSLFHPQTLLYTMPMERSIDIDSEFDLELVSLLLAKTGEKHG